MEQKKNQPNPEIENKDSIKSKAEKQLDADGFRIIYKHSSGGIVWQHILVNVKATDYKEILEIAMDKAGIGCEVHMLPTLPEDHPLRKTLFKNAKERKCPDLKINGRYVEVKIQ